MSTTLPKSYLDLGDMLIIQHIIGSCNRQMKGDEFYVGNKPVEFYTLGLTAYGDNHWFALEQAGRTICMFERGAVTYTVWFVEDYKTTELGALIARYFWNCKIKTLIHGPIGYDAATKIGFMRDGKPSLRHDLLKDNNLSYFFDKFYEYTIRYIAMMFENRLNASRTGTDTKFSDVELFDELRSVFAEFSYQYHDTDIYHNVASILESVNMLRPHAKMLLLTPLEGE